jgi:O-antigen ligase
LRRHLVARILPGIAGSVIALSLVFGGGTAHGLWSDAVVQLASLLLLATALWCLYQMGVPPHGKSAIILLAAVIALPLVQLLPLPPGWWDMLPGRGPIAAAYDSVGMTRPWLPLSLTQAATWRSALSLLPAAAIFIGTLCLDSNDRRRLVLMVLALVLLSIGLDFLQVISGPHNSLHLYSLANEGHAAGFFANRNHNAALLYSAIPLAAAWGMGLTRRHPHQRQWGMLLIGVLVAGSVLGLVMTNSRAGIGLGFVSGMFSMAIIAVDRNRGVRRTRLLIAIGGNLFALLVAFQLGFIALLQHIDAQSISDIRWPVAVITAHAALGYMPFGTGFGSFAPIFQSVEPRSLLASYYINHAHDDWLELWLEGGLPAVFLAAAFLLWFARRTWSAWRTTLPRVSRDISTLSRAGSIVIVLLLLHSTVDYPLRTTALNVLFALSAGLLIAPLTRFGAPEALVPE